MSQTSYHQLAPLYDILQQDVNICQWADYIESLAARFSLRQQTGDGPDGRPILLDLGCGTGSFCLEMARRNYEPIGVDLSVSMLDQARQKMARYPDAAPERRCLFLQQDISRFELYGTVDLAVCLLDTINHLTRPAQIKRLFQHCANYLNPGSLLIFDLVSARHLSRTLGNQVFFQDHPDYTLLWQNSYRRASSISRANLILFQKKPDGSYCRAEEQIAEKHYAPHLIKHWIKESGLEFCGRFADLRLAKPAAHEARCFYVARKPLPQ